MLARLPILLAQVQAGNNSRELKNEIRQLLYSLYRSKKISKTVYKKLNRGYLKMETIFMNTANSKTKHSNKFVYNFTDTLNLKNPNKNIALANLSIYYTWKNVKSDYNNNKFKISAPTWNGTFDVLDGSYSIAALQKYFEYTIKKHETIADVSPVLIHVNEINKRIVFKNNYKLESLSKETMRLLGSSSDNIDGDKNSELVPKLESVDLVLVHCNLVNNSYQQASKVLFTFVPNKKYG